MDASVNCAGDNVLNILLEVVGKSMTECQPTAWPGPASFAAPLGNDPKHLLGIGIDYSGGLSMAFEQGELVADQPPNPALLRLGHLPLKALIIDDLDRMPV